MSERSNESKRREILKFLGGIGLGAAIAETYERLYNIPLLERGFRKEIEYWLSQYNSAKQRLDDLSNQLKQKEGEINTLKEKVSNLENQYNVAKEETNRLNSTINKLDELERESTSAIAYYREKMDEAMRNLKRTIEKYRAILGDDRVAFESSTVKILEDLKLTQEKLQKVLPYFPLILNFAWKPTRVINDKIYDINVSFEVASPLNSLREVEVMLIPVEYRYFITKYGMREEDYHKVFPKEEVRSVKIKPRNLEREMFSVDFEDLKGGREYIVKARVEYVVENEKKEKIKEVKTPYMRKYENLGKYARISVIPFYYTWHLPELWKNVPYRPILGTYNSHDPLVLDKHIDEITGYGMNTICIEWVGGNDWTVDNIKNNLLKNSTLINTNEIRWFLLYDLVATGRLIFDEEGFINVDNQHNRSIIINDFEELSYYFTHPTYYKDRDGRPYIFWYLYRALKGDVEGLVKEIKKKYNPYIVGDLVYWQLPEELIRAKNIAQYVDSISTYSMYLSNPNILSHDVFLKEVETRFKLWSDYAKQINKDFAPVVIPGYNDQLLRGNKNPVLETSVEFFRRQLDITERYSTESIYVCTFNEGPEGTGIERTIEWDDTFLQEVRRFALNEK
jgi:polyhydroxyalkanoate synthesis regulator phasin